MKAGNNEKECWFGEKQTSLYDPVRDSVLIRCIVRTKLNSVRPLKIFKSDDIGTWCHMALKIAMR